MKKKKYMLLVGMLLMLAVVMTGCSDDAEDRLEDEVDRLEQQVTDLQKEQATGSSTGDISTSNVDNITGTPQDFATLEAEVNALVEKVENTMPDSAEAGKLEQYFAHKKEIESVDRKMDVYDDMIEQQYRQNQISLEDLKTQERNVDVLENKLDAAEDKLELTFGIDD